MPTTETFNIVLLGEGFPVTSVRGEDFEFLGRPLREQIRLPVVVEISAGEFRLQVTPDRAQFAVVKANATQDKVEALVNNALSYLREYAGRRSVAAVGLNVLYTFSADEMPRQRLLEDLLPTARLSASLGVEALPHGEYTFMFRSARTNRAHLKLLLPLDDELIRVDFNFHFDVGQGAAADQAVRELPGCLEDSLELANRLRQLVSAEAGT